MNEIIPGIFRMPIPIRNNPLGATNTYLIKGNDGYLLIDAGWNSPDAFESMEHQLAEAGLTFTDIRKILVTHVHPDHYGLVPAVRERSGAEIMLHRIEKDLLLNRYSAINDALFDIETVFRRNHQLHFGSGIALRFQDFFAVAENREFLQFAVP